MEILHIHSGQAYTYRYFFVSVDFKDTMYYTSMIRILLTRNGWLSLKFFFLFVLIFYTELHKGKKFKNGLSGPKDLTSVLTLPLQTT